MKNYRATITFQAEDDADARRIAGALAASPDVTLTDIEAEASYWPSIPLEEGSPETVDAL